MTVKQLKFHVQLHFYFSVQYCFCFENPHKQVSVHPDILDLYNPYLLPSILQTEIEFFYSLQYTYSLSYTHTHAHTRCPFIGSLCKIDLCSFVQLCLSHLPLLCSFVMYDLHLQPPGSLTSCSERTSKLWFFFTNSVFLKLWSHSNLHNPSNTFSMISSNCLFSCAIRKEPVFTRSHSSSIYHVRLWVSMRLWLIVL